MKNETPVATDKKEAFVKNQSEKTASTIKVASAKALEVQDTAGAEMPDASALKGTTKEDAKAGFAAQAKDLKPVAKK